MDGEHGPRGAVAGEAGFHQARAIVAHEGGGLVFRHTWCLGFCKDRKRQTFPVFQARGPAGWSALPPGDLWTPPASSPSLSAILPGEQSKLRGRSFAAGSSTARRPQRCFSTWEPFRTHGTQSSLPRCRHRPLRPSLASHGVKVREPLIAGPL